ncbi:MAG TPA: serine--tRNA ligase [Flavobacteriales bacterium]|mgnify:CR=1 FL=1|nr:serine--tRNA ligase [Flavobacteriales bacterium]HPH83362.1 serine--tRNA ligase [Flavobacteriales bacterium]
MLQVPYLRENKEAVIAGLAKRNNLDARERVDQIIALDDMRKSVQTELDSKLARANQIAREIGELFKSGKAAEANVLKEETATIKEESKNLEGKLAEAEEAIRQILYTIPNVPATAIPFGRGSEENVTVESHGEIPVLHADAQPHWDLAKKYDIIDFELGVKVTGAGFPFYKGKGARLQRALINFFLERATAAGYTEYQAPLMVNADSGFGTGQLPDKEGQMYYMQVDDFYMIPTAEVPITNIFRDTIQKAEDFPIKACGYTPCFRREAGSYGKDVRGLNRLHQFDKVEIVQIAHPDQSYTLLEEMRNHVTGLLKELELPYRVLQLCGGDMGFASAFTYDMEVYSAAQGKWLEVSSTSNFEAFQSNRLKLRFREGDSKPRLAHTLNGSALALPRIVAALLENHQTPEGIRIPKALVPYCGFDLLN